MLADGEEEPAPVNVHEQLFEGLVQVEGLPGDVLAIPGQRAIGDVHRQRGAGVERGVGGAEAAAGGHPGLGLRGPPVDEPESRVVAAGGPGVPAATQVQGEVAPGVPARFPRPRDGVGPPQLHPGVRVVRGDEAAVLEEALAAVDAVDDPPLHHDGTRHVGVSLAGVGDLCVPHGLAGARVERHQARVLGGHEHVALIQRQVAQLVEAPGTDVVGEFAPVLPQQIAAGRVQRLDDVARVGEKHDPVEHQRGRLVGAIGHGPHPGQLQVGDVLPPDLVERAVPPGVVGAPVHQPVGGIRVAQHGIRHRRERPDAALHGGPAGRARRLGGGLAGGVGGRGRGLTSAGFGARGGGLCEHIPHRLRGSQRSLVGGRPVGLQQEGGHRQVLRLAERPRLLRGHLAHHRQQLAQRSPPPGGEEVTARQLGCLEVPAQVGAMAFRARTLVYPASGLHLVRNQAHRLLPEQRCGHHQRRREAARSQNIHGHPPGVSGAAMRSVGQRIAAQWVRAYRTMLMPSA